MKSDPENTEDTLMSLFNLLKLTKKIVSLKDKTNPATLLHMSDSFLMKLPTYLSELLMKMENTMLYYKLENKSPY